MSSIVSQSDVQIEIIVCDDRSSDGTLDIVHKTARTFPNAKWVIRENPARLGMVENWNACLALARYPMVKILGQDDILYPDCLAFQARVLASHPSASLVASRRAIINADGRKILTAPAPFEHGLTSGKPAAIRCLLSGTNTIGDPVAVLSRTEVLRQTGGFDPSFRYCTDVAMLMHLLARGDFFFDPIPRVGYRVHAGAVGHSSQHIVVSEFCRCVELAERLFNFQFTSRTRKLIAFKSHALSVVRRRLYHVLNTWPFTNIDRSVQTTTS